MNRLHSLLISIFIVLLLSSCTPPPSDTKPTPEKPPRVGKNGKASTDRSVVDEDSLPIDAEELKELSNPDAQPNPEAESEVKFLRTFRIGESLDEVRKSCPSEYKLGNPTTEIPVGQLAEDEVVVPIDGPLKGYFHFEGKPDKVGKLIMLEVFTDNKAYQNGINKKRIRVFTKILGKPTSINKDEEDDAGNPLYVVDWRDSKTLIRYQDDSEWGSTLSINPVN